MAYMDMNAYFANAQAEEALGNLEAKYRKAPLDPNKSEGRSIVRFVSREGSWYFVLDDGSYVGIDIDGHDDCLCWAHAKFPDMVAMGLVSEEDNKAYDEALSVARGYDRAAADNVALNRLIASVGKEKLLEMIEKSK